MIGKRLLGSTEEGLSRAICWSPDDAYLAVVTNHHIYILSASHPDFAIVVKLALAGDNQILAERLEWSPNFSFLAVFVYCMCPDSRPIHALTRICNGEPFASSAGTLTHCSYALAVLLAKYPLGHIGWTTHGVYGVHDMCNGLYCLVQCQTATKPSTATLIPCLHVYGSRRSYIHAYCRVHMNVHGNSL